MLFTLSLVYRDVFVQMLLKCSFWPIWPSDEYIPGNGHIWPSGPYCSSALLLLDYAIFGPFIVSTPKERTCFTLICLNVTYLPYLTSSCMYAYTYTCTWCVHMIHSVTKNGWFSRFLDDGKGGTLRPSHNRLFWCRIIGCGYLNTCISKCSIMMGSAGVPVLTV